MKFRVLRVAQFVLTKIEKLRADVDTMEPLAKRGDDPRDKPTAAPKIKNTVMRLEIQRIDEVLRFVGFVRPDFVESTLGVHSEVITDQGIEEILSIIKFPPCGRRGVRHRRSGEWGGGRFRLCLRLFHELVCAGFEDRDQPSDASFMRIL